jgi:cyclopropane fatty-acyl-phospholipid synthase-like methyltransferase
MTSRLPRLQSRAVPLDLPYREFYYPLNVFMYVLSREEGAVPYLHYGLFENADERIGVAQERSTELLLSRLPPPPATLLEVGIGLGTTLARLAGMGYDVTGITPDLKQIAMVRERFADQLRVLGTAFEHFEENAKFDCVFFQESSQYIDARALFQRARDLTEHIVVIDEFALEPVDTPGALHSLERFVAVAADHDFEKVEELDLSLQAAPTVRYFIDRLPRYRDRIVADLGIAPQQIDDLIENGARYHNLYRSGVYGYRLLVFRR